MKLCNYCGRENENDAVNCRECGMAQWKQVMPAEPPTARTEPEPQPTVPHAIVTRTGLATTIQCRGLLEASLVAEQLEEADIVTLVPEDLESNCLVGSEALVTVQVSTKALEAEKELCASVAFTYEQQCAQQPLPLMMKIIALCLPAILHVGFILLFIEAQRFTNQGLERKAGEWVRWFAFGFFGWLIIVVFVA